MTSHWFASSRAIRCRHPRALKLCLFQSFNSTSKTVDTYRLHWSTSFSVRLLLRLSRSFNSCGTASQTQSCLNVNFASGSRSLSFFPNALRLRSSIILICQFFIAWNRSGGRLPWKCERQGFPGPLPPALLFVGTPGGGDATKGKSSGPNFQKQP